MKFTEVLGEITIHMVKNNLNIKDVAINFPEGDKGKLINMSNIDYIQYSKFYKENYKKWIPIIERDKYDRKICTYILY